MGGFKRAMPFTFACFVIGGLALAGVPPFSGFFSKDEILAEIGARGGGWHWVFYVAGYVGAILTAIYTWRMIFRAFWGEPCPEARELEEGHLHHAEAPFNPANGEIEDTDVGFPGPEHHIAERGCADEGRDGRPRGPGDVRRPVQVPWVDRRCRSSSSRRSPTSTLASSSPATGAHRRRPGRSARCSALAGIYIAYRVWVLQPGTSERVRERFACLHRLFVNKWYFDELIDLVVVRPCGVVRALRPADLRARGHQRRLRRRDDAGSSRPGSAAARALQNGFLRAYAALLVLGDRRRGLLLPDPELMTARRRSTSLGAIRRPVLR